MSAITQLCYVMILMSVVDHCLKPYPVRKWLGISLWGAGTYGLFAFPDKYWYGLDIWLVSLLILSSGSSLFFRRRRFDHLD
ncbi:hypothetical protein D3C76_1071890 [compost metagenome]|uniref:Uncharacterized protein n=1 Tax=Pseudomonas wadenswilerensis TaxID=1785161 RepID=A0A380SXW6_9PSED|nr:hypothetical protein CCOS864_02048 [Pseudomonas wadenswilerensis]